MHQCLQIAEVIDLIIENVFQKPHNIPSTPRRSMLSTALTCKAFLNPALDRLWRDSDLRDFRQIISCLPDDLFERDVSKHTYLEGFKVDYVILNSRRAITPKDLERYLTVYAPRIRNWYFSLPSLKEFVWPSFEVFQALRSATSHKIGALSPRLQNFDGGWVPNEVFKEERAQFFPFISLFLGPEVEILRLEFDSRDLDSSADKAVQSILQNLPRLKRIVIDDAADHPISFAHNWVAHSPWKNLEFIAVLPALSSAALANLSSLPYLTDLVCTLKSSTGVTHWGSKPGIRFPSLRHIRVDSDSFAPIAQALRGIRQAGSGSVEGALLKASQSSSSDFNALIQTLGANKRLKKVSITGNVTGDTGSAQNAASRATTDLSPLIESFPTIHTLHIDVAFNDVVLPFTPKVAHAMALSCLNLQSLHTGGGPRCTPAIDHTHLLDIVRGCPALTDLKVMFDASRITTTPESNENRIERQGLVIQINLESPISSPERVLAFFKNFFSNDLRLDLIDTGKSILEYTRAQKALFFSWDKVIDQWRMHSIIRKVEPERRILAPVVSSLQRG